MKQNSRQTNLCSYKFLSRQAWREYGGGHLSSWVYSASSSRYWLLVCSVYENSTSHKFKIPEMVCDCILELKVKIVHMYLKIKFLFFWVTVQLVRLLEWLSSLKLFGTPGSFSLAVSSSCPESLKPLLAACIPASGKGHRGLIQDKNVSSKVIKWKLHTSLPLTTLTRTDSHGHA